MKAQKDKASACESSADIKSEIDVWSKSVKVEENLYYWNDQPILTKGSNFNTKKLCVVELFCGCGGTSLGFEMAGFEAILGCDIHQPSINTFKKNHPKVSTILGDVKKVSPRDIEKLIEGRKIDVLIAGVPCQGFSLNNRKRHENDDRNNLYKEFLRFVKYLKPRSIVLENVSGMKSTGDYVSRIETDLSQASGMVVKSNLLYAPDYGVPQKRQRLIFVGVQGSDFDFGKIKKTHGVGTKNAYVTVKDAIGDLPRLLPAEESKVYLEKALTPYQKMMRADVSPKSLTNHNAPNHPLATIDKIRNTKPGFPMYPNFKQRIRLSWDILSPTQVSGGIRPQFQFGHPADPRGLTIRERCRLQSFPDSFEVTGGIVQGRVQTGNAVPPLLARAVALALKSYL